MKKIVIALYIVVVAIMAAATIIEKYEGTIYVSDNIYGAWWFSALWSLLTAMAIFYFIKRHVRRPSVVALHLSLVIILSGALLTHLTSMRGFIHLRQGQPANEYLSQDMRPHSLPFSLCLEHFEVKYHEGTMATIDYISHVKFYDGPTDNGISTIISMNNIAAHKGIRFYQSSYDEDQQGSILAINSDPWGIPVTYSGYALLFVSFIWILVDPKGSYRQLLRRTIVVFFLGFINCHIIAANKSPRTLPTETADRFAKLFIVYNDRVCPIETYAIDFTKKLYGKRSYNGYTATQVLTGFIFFYDDWTQEPIIKIKGSEMKERLHLPAYSSFNRFFNQNGYILGPYLQEKNMSKTDEKVLLIMELHQGLPLKIFPHTDKKGTIWYTPTDSLPKSMSSEHQKYIHEVFTRLNSDVQLQNYDRVNQYLDKMILYQQTFGRQSLPRSARIQAEFIYNKIPFATILFMICLSLGFLSFIWQILTPRHTLLNIQRVLLAILWLTLTFCLALRWIITNHIPLANGYETMLFLAWSVMLLSLLISRHFPIMLTFGFLLSGFFLLVSHISQIDPQMSHLMPVLNSPLLTIHVSIIMMSYALLSLTFICGVTALIWHQQASSLQQLSQLFIYPALATLGIGIFIGAIWANISWGTYWSWDPKETWALITLMIYAISVHTESFPALRRPKIYHLFMTLAFITILITYFGVNYFLGGMHSYA